MAKRVVVIGGGLAGLVAAVACAEAGAKVTLYEAHNRLGGRGRAIGGPYLAHGGGHVFYADDPNWAWLRERGLVGALGRPAPRDFRMGFVRDGRLRALPPAGFVRMMATGPATAPVDVDFHTWASARFGERTARAAANAISVVTLDADTGRLSAAFVWNLLRRVFALRVPAVRWVVGGWQAVIDRLAARARDLGVAVELGARVNELPAGPVVVATELSSARLLLGDPGLRWESGDCVLFDLAVRSARGDRFVVWDLDAGGFHESYSMQDPTAAPAGETLFQLDMPIRKDESRAEALRRVEALADLTVPGWRERVTWRRSAAARHRSGALDLPGLTWRDRPAVERGDGVFLAGDMVAAPGMRGEISIASALGAAGGALRALRLAGHATR